MTQNHLEINVIYCSKEGREVLFTDIVNNADVMALEDYEPSNYWNVLGGFEVTLNGHFTIFRSCSFYCLVKATSFLISSIYWLEGKTSEWFDYDEKFPNIISINPTPDTTVKLERLNDTELLFSYTNNKEEYISRRGDRYFCDVKISTYDWITQTTIAMNEYFTALSFVLDKNDKDDKIAKTMKEYLDVWHNIAAP